MIEKADVWSSSCCVLTEYKSVLARTPPVQKTAPTGVSPFVNSNRGAAPRRGYLQVPAEPSRAGRTKPILKRKQRQVTETSKSSCDEIYRHCEIGE